VSVPVFDVTQNLLIRFVLGTDALTTASADVSSIFTFPSGKPRGAFFALFVRFAARSRGLAGFLLGIHAGAAPVCCCFLCCRHYV
jgi:hypothetical protein